jgi:hypothetical protein
MPVIMNHSNYYSLKIFLSSCYKFILQKLFSVPLAIKVLYHATAKALLWIYDLQQYCTFISIIVIKSNNVNCVGNDNDLTN